MEAVPALFIAWRLTEEGEVRNILAEARGRQ